MCVFLSVRKSLHKVLINHFTYYACFLLLVLKHRRLCMYLYVYVCMHVCMLLLYVECMHKCLCFELSRYYFGFLAAPAGLILQENIRRKAEFNTAKLQRILDYRFLCPFRLFVRRRRRQSIKENSLSALSAPQRTCLECILSMSIKFLGLRLLPG